MRKLSAVRHHSGGADTVRADAIHAIHSDFDGKLWGLREEGVAPCAKTDSGRGFGAMQP